MDYRDTIYTVQFQYQRGAGRAERFYDQQKAHERCQVLRNNNNVTAIQFRVNGEAEWTWRREDEERQMRSERVTISVTEGEYQSIRRAAFKAGYNSISTFLYDEMLKPAIDTRPLFLDGESKKVKDEGES